MNRFFVLTLSLLLLTCSSQGVLAQTAKVRLAVKGMT
jgi:hypothetical protein